MVNTPPMKIIKNVKNLIPAKTGAIISTFGIPKAGGYIPTPEIFIFGGLISILAVIPILFINKSEGKIILD
jgi:hypothetical protein